MTKLKIEKSTVRMTLSDRPHTGRVSISEIIDILNETSLTYPTFGYIEKIEIGEFGDIILNVEYDSPELLAHFAEDRAVLIQALTDTWDSEESQMLSAAGLV